MVTRSRRYDIIRIRSILSNPVSFAGVLIACVSTIIILFIIVADWFGFNFNPYIGVFAFLVLPVFFVGGITMIPAGKAWERRRRAQRAGLPPGLIRFEIDLDQARTRHRILVLVATATIVLAFMSATAYESVKFMDTTTFCGDVCHSVMEPELTSYRHGSHARVPCVDCHIGEGADWYVKSKLSGIGQVVAVTLDTYDTPIPSPVHNLRPARETCERCHWPEKFHGSRLVVNTHFTDDEVNTRYQNVLLMKTGGGSAATGVMEGIHWHMNIKNRVEYVALDEKRLDIPYVKLTGPDGTVTEYFSENSEIPQDELRAMPRRVMDCMDCHNRPAHTFEVPSVAVDQAMVAKQIPQDLPYVKRESVKLLTAEYQSRDEAEDVIRLSLQGYYEDTYPDIYRERQADIDSVARALATIYKRNVFPSMKITWGTYENNIGHTYSTGCFRCHDEEHETPNGKKTISQECDACHQLLAYEEEHPEPVLENLPLR